MLSIQSARMRQNKYRNRKVTVDGKRFDSKKEAKRYLELQDLNNRGIIHGLQLQREFELIPSQKIDGKVAERAVKYRADFTYYDALGKLHVEDTKGVKTPEYIIKRKLMLYIHKIRIKEV
jgi:hypothetical protein